MYPASAAKHNKQMKKKLCGVYVLLFFSSSWPDQQTAAD